MEEHKITKLKSNHKFVLTEKYKFYDKSFWHRLISFLHRLVAVVVFKFWINVFYKIKVVGKVNLKYLKKQGFVVVSNHVHVLDIQMIAMNVFGMRKVNYLTLERNFNLSVHRLLKNSGAIPIPDNDELKPKFFSEMNKLLKEGNILHICPEGALYDNNTKLQPFKNGAFRFALENNVPVVPITLQLDYKKNKENKIKYNILVNNPIYPNMNYADIKTETEVFKKKVFNLMRKQVKAKV